VNDPDWAFRADDNAILDALTQGRRRAELSNYFGAAAAAQLARLAAAAACAPRRPGPQVLIVPGIMGSKLGAAPQGRRTAGRGMIWFDPAAISAGRLAELALPRVAAIEPRGVQLFTYTRLILELRLQGFDVATHAYDWRLGIDALGAQLAERVAATPGPALLIGHSMGGLVARIALGLLPRHKVRRLILVGTPNLGSYAAVQALRGTYGFVRKVSRLDPTASPEALAARVFHSFTGLYHLLPAGGARGIVDVCRPERWPRQGLAPDPVQLARVAAVRAALAPPDARMLQIVGIDHPTVVGLHRGPRGFVYRMGWRGDGTVPLASARLPGLPTWYVSELHGRLPSNGEVIRAIIGLLRSGRTNALPRFGRSRTMTLPDVDDALLRRVGRGKIDWRQLDARSREAVLADLNS
jgi:pimeloyl-ACP methyl ester carboxylesterase